MRRASRGVVRAGRTATRCAAPAALLPPSPAPRSSAERALSTHAPRSPPPPPLDVAAIRALDVAGVVAFAESLGIDADDAQLLRAQKVDGAALLETTRDQLCDWVRMPFGPACAIMRAVAAAQRAEATLLVYPPFREWTRHDIPVTVTLTPAEFTDIYVLSKTPLLLVSSDGDVLRCLMSLEQAVEATRDAGSARLRSLRVYCTDPDPLWE